MCFMPSGAPALLPQTFQLLRLRGSAERLVFKAALGAHGGQGCEGARWTGLLSPLALLHALGSGNPPRQARPWSLGFGGGGSHSTGPCFPGRVLGRSSPLHWARTPQPEAGKQRLPAGGPGAGGAERGAPAHHALQDAPGHREGADPLRGLRQGQQPDDPRAAAGPVPQLPLLQTVGGRAGPGGLAPGRAENVCVCLCVCVSGAPGRAESVCVCSCVCPCVCVCV